MEFVVTSGFDQWDVAIMGLSCCEHEMAVAFTAISTRVRPMVRANELGRIEIVGASVEKRTGW